MKNIGKFCCLATLGISSIVCSNNAYAAKSSVSIMTPRNTINIAKDYTYGYKYLPGDALDVYETYNRKIGFKVNYDFLDAYMLRPVSVGYVTYIPEPIRVCIHNMLSNLGEFHNTINNSLIGEFGDAGISTSRLLINSTIGLAGCFDVAGAWGLDKREMSLKTVLGKWGWQQGGYVHVPFAGGLTFRDAMSYVIDRYYYPFYFFNWWQGLIYLVINAIDARSSLLAQDDVLKNSLDPYVQLRDFYLMYQEKLVSGDTYMMSSESKEDTEAVDEYLDEID